MKYLKAFVIVLVAILLVLFGYIIKDKVDINNNQDNVLVEDESNFKEINSNILERMKEPISIQSTLKKFEYSNVNIEEAIVNGKLEQKDGYYILTADIRRYITFTQEQLDLALNSLKNTTEDYYDFLEVIVGNKRFDIVMFTKEPDFFNNQYIDDLPDMNIKVDDKKIYIMSLDAYNAKSINIDDYFMIEKMDEKNEIYALASRNQAGAVFAPTLATYIEENVIKAVLLKADQMKVTIENYYTGESTTKEMTVEEYIGQKVEGISYNNEDIEGNGAGALIKFNPSGYIYIKQVTNSI